MRNSRRCDRSTATAHRHNRRGLWGRHSPFRSFLALVALALSLHAAPAAAQTPCTRTGTATAVTVTCKGDQSDGIRESDILDAIPTTPAFPGTGMPPTPAAETITVNVRELTAEAAARPVPDAGIRLFLRGAGNLPAPTRSAPSTPPPPEATQEQRGLGVFTLDVDLGALRIAPGTTGADLVEPAIPLAVNNTSAVIVNARDQLRTSLFLHLRGDFRTTGLPVQSFIEVQNDGTAPSLESAGDVDITLRANSRIKTLVDDFSSAIHAEADRGNVSVTLESGVSLTAEGPARPQPPQLPQTPVAIRAVTNVTGTGNTPGDVRVKVEGRTAAGDIPNVQIDGPNGVAVLLVGISEIGQNLFEEGIVELTTMPDSYIRTTGTDSVAVHADSVGKNISIAVAGTVETQGDAGPDPNVVTFFGARGSLGIDARTVRAPEVLVTVQSTGSVTTGFRKEDDGTLTITGREADAIRLSSQGQEVIQNPNPRPDEERLGLSTLRAIVDGTVITAGDEAAGLRARVPDSNVPMITTGVGNIDLRVGAGGTITTRGMEAHGIVASIERRGDVVVTVDGTVRTGVLGKQAMQTMAEMQTMGTGAHGILAQTEQGDVGITVDGTVTTMGTNARGVSAETNAGNVVVSVAGTVQTTGMAMDDPMTPVVEAGPQGIQASTGGGNMTVSVSGRVSTMGERARGVEAQTEAGDVTAVMGMRRVGGMDQTVTTSRIATTGDGADGISLQSRGPAPGATGTTTRIAANIVAGTISTEGNNAVALRAMVDDGDPMTTAVGDITLSVGEAGTLTTQGTTAHAIEAMTEQGDVGIIVDGTVTTMETNARGVRAATNAGNVVVSVAGTVQTGVMATQRRGAPGIRAQTEAGDVTAMMGMRRVGGMDQIVTTSGVTTTGDGADGISLQSGGPAPPPAGPPPPPTTRVSAHIVEGTISTMGNEAAGLRALVDDDGPGTAVGNIDVTSSGRITTMGTNAHGILAQTEAGDVTAVMGMRRVGGMDQTVTTSRITTEGAGAHGISLQSGGPTPGATETTTRITAAVAAGTISTMGNSAVALRALVDDGDPMTTAVGDITLSVGEMSDRTTLITRGTSAHAIEAMTEQGEVVVIANGIVTTRGGLARGIKAQTEAGDVTAVMGMRRVGGVDQTVTTSRITTRGPGADGISLQSGGPAPGAMSDPTRIAATIAAGTISTEGAESAALRARVDDGGTGTAIGNIVLRVESEAKLETRGRDAHGLVAMTEEGEVSVTIAGEVQTGVTDDSMTPTRGQGALGIQAQTGAGDITVNVMGRVNTQGDDAVALRATVEDSDPMTPAVGNITLRLEEAGTLATQGTTAHAIEAMTEQGEVVVTANGIVTTRGTNAHGILAQTEAGNVVVSVAGTVQTTGMAMDNPMTPVVEAGPLGIQAQTGAGDITVNVMGRVNTQGDDAVALSATVENSDPMTPAVGNITLRLEEAGTLTTQGTTAHAIEAMTEQGEVVVTANGIVTTRGTNAHGILAQTEAGDVTAVMGVRRVGGMDQTVTTSRITTRGAGAHGISLQSGGPAPGATGITMRLAAAVAAGTISTMGDNAVALRARVDDDGPGTAVGNITLRLEEAGTLTTQGTTAHAIEATTEQGEVVVIANGIVTTRGTSAHGVRARTPVGDVTAVVGRTVVDGTVRTVASSRIETRGMGAHGIDAETGDGTVEIEAGGSVETRGAGGHAIRAVTGEGRVRVAAGGSVETRGAGGDAIRAVTGDGTVAVTVQRGRVFAAAAAATTAAAVRAQAGLGPSQRLQLTVQEGGEVEGELAVAFTGGSDMAANPNRILLEAGSRLTGTLALGAGADLLENRGLLVLLGSSQFGAGVDRFLQAGQLELGRVGQVEAVSVWGLESVEFTSDSLLVIDVDGIGARTDRLEFGAETTGGAGPAVTLGGVVQVRELPGRGNFRVGDRRFEIFSAGRLVGGAGALRLISPTSSPARMFRRFYQLVGEDGATELGLVERTEGSFFDPNAPRNARAVGLKLDRVARRAELPEAIEVLLSTLGDMERGPPYETAQNRLHAEPYDALLQGSWHAERALVDALWEGCVPGPGGHCVFGGLFGRRLDREGEPVQADFEELAVGPRGGVSRHLGELGGRSWLLRVGAAYEALDLEWREGAGGRGDRLLGGMALHSHSAAGGSDDPWRGLDGLNAGLALAGGGAWFETERALNQLGFTRAEAEPELTFLGGHGRLLYRLGATQRDPGWYAELGLEGSAVALWLDSFSEEEGTAGVLRLRLAETRELVTSVRPQLSLGGSWQWGELHIAPRARLGFSYAVGGADTPYQADWIAVPNCSLTTWGDRENGLIEASGGLAVTLGEEISLRLDYTGRVSPDGTTRSHEGQLRAELRF